MHSRNMSANKGMIGAAAWLLAMGVAVPAALAAEPDGLILPPGFHARVVEDVGKNARHIAIRANGDMYISTIDFAALSGKGPGPVTGIIALHQGNAHADATVTHFGTVVNGTGIGFYKGALYAASPTAIMRYQFTGHELVPSAAPETVLDG